jgi:iron(III) transport system substrate-binding protein
MTFQKNFSNRLSRRQFLVTAGTSALGTLVLQGGQSRLLAQAQGQDEASLYAAAKKEGKIVYYMGYLTQDLLNDINAAFTKKYPGIQFEGTRKPAGPLFQQLNQEMQAGLKNCDVFGTAEMGQMLQLNGQGKLLEYQPSSQNNLRPVLRNLKANFYQPGALLPIIIGYNTKLLKPDAAPKSWKDLLNPKYKDQISIGSAAASGQLGLWALLMSQKYGWDNYFNSFNQLNPKIGRSINDGATDLISGERALGIVSLGQILAAKAKGNPVDAVYPAEGTVVAIGPVAILQDAPHPNAAKLLMNFLMSQEYSQLATKYHEQPLRSDVKVKSGKPLEQTQTLMVTPEQLRAEIPQIQRQWREMFGA